MSLGGAVFNSAEYEAIQGAVGAGVAFAVAAGNEDDDAVNYYPAAFGNVLTVSALADFDGLPGGLGAPTCRSDQDDTLADFSNWGEAVDIAAPGVCILSTLPLEQGGYGIMSGTSMASPHAAGALALLASATPRPENPDELAGYVNDLYYQVKSAGNDNWTDNDSGLDDLGDGIKEPLLDVSNPNIFDPVLIAVGGTNTVPSVSITSPTAGSSFASGEMIDFAGTAIDTEDGNLTGSLEWTSNLDGPIGTSGSFTAALSTGTHTITATATDSEGLSGSASVTITVGTASDIDLAVIARTKGVNKYADLTWKGGDSSLAVEIKRDGDTIATTANDGEYTEKIAKTTTSATYQVCQTNAGTSITTCSDAVTVSW